jgi:glycosyltransferase involved in cell wall biosynthesis
MNPSPRIVVLVHGAADSIEAVRARGLTQQYPRDQARLLWRDQPRFSAWRAWTRAIKAFSPDLLYVVNTAMPGALLACWWRCRQRLPFILDTGDVVYEMAARAGTVARAKLPALKIVESLAQRMADTVVVRGTRHQEFLQRQGYRRVRLIRDGFMPMVDDTAEAEARLKARLGLENQFIVGVMGSLVYSPRLGICYGWDLVRALAQVRDLPIRGLVIGDGPGRGWLENQARAYGVGDRVVFCGRVPYAEVPVYLRLADVVLSTQTNNLPGQVRTTGKLPEYMAAERFILASRVGEAALVLPEEMLLDYEGEVDPEYPCKLAARLRVLCSEPRRLEARHALRTIAEKEFSYTALSAQFNQVVASVRAPEAGVENPSTGC